MAAPSNFLCAFGPKTLTLAPGVPQVVDVPIAGAHGWTVSIVNTGANALTALSVTRIPITQPTATVAVDSSGGIPLAAGEALPPIVGENAPITILRLTLSSAGGTTVSIEAGGA